MDVWSAKVPPLSVVRKNVLLLALCQAAMMTGQVLMLATAPFIGVMLASDKSLATLPIGIQLSATLVMVMPAAFIMKRTGRRLGFMLGALFGVIGAVLAACALVISSFELYCAGLALTGFFNAFGTYYRFAGADAAGPEYRSAAISYVLAGGVIAALLGPSLARWTADVVLNAPFSGSYLSLAAVYASTFVALLFVQIPRPTLEERSAYVRPLAQIAKQPTFLVAVIAAMVGYGAMNLVMTATPLAMHEHHYFFGDAASVIQWHVLGMFVPSFFTPILITRFGLLKVMRWGAMLCMACIALNVFSMTMWAISLALIVLGIGWNFLAVGSSTLLTQASAPQEKAKTQAVCDFLTLVTTTLTAFSSAPLHQRYGWSLVNFSVVPALALIVLAISWLRTARISKPEMEVARLNGGSHDTKTSSQHSLPDETQHRMRSISWRCDPTHERRY